MGPGGSLLWRQQVTTFILFRHGIASGSSMTWGRHLAPCMSLDPVGTCQKFPGQVVPWNYQQIRTKARGNEYQPSNLKRKHKHGWIKRIRSASGIEVILRRMLKGRKSLSH
ncbi:39S ribosomal protein L34, mitochondrial [Eublepharis macularius]|uniref:Large ribosomal subunit protein bL34m n=1 Tax=Eublepharis macularius TaxID=481883 RepID=A0AA97JHA4_EUBMA|nr:39S ribosomal protein L34, mitochondrial [Eublepharis macularius]